jgi:hypothetical protein
LHEAPSANAPCALVGAAGWMGMMVCSATVV